MDIIKYEGLEVHTPTGWGEVPLEVYEKIYKRDASTIEKKISVLETLLGLEPDSMLDYRMPLVDEIINRCLFIFKPHDAEPSPIIDIDGVRYSLPTEDELTLAQWVKATTQHDKGNDSISNLLAVVCLPVGESYDSNKVAERAKMFRAQTMDKVQPLLAFFLMWSRLYGIKIKSSLLAQDATLKYQNIMQTTQRAGVGTRLLRSWLKATFYVLTKYHSSQLKQSLSTLFTGRRKGKQTRRNANTKNS